MRILRKAKSKRRLRENDKSYYYSALFARNLIKTGLDLNLIFLLAHYAAAFWPLISASLSKSFDEVHAMRAMSTHGTLLVSPCTNLRS